MKVTADKNEKIETMTFASVYPHYVNKVVKKAERLKSFIESLNG